MINFEATSTNERRHSWSSDLGNLPTISTEINFNGFAAICLCSFLILRRSGFYCMHTLQSLKCILMSFFKCFQYSIFTHHHKEFFNPKMTKFSIIHSYQKFPTFMWAQYFSFLLFFILARIMPSFYLNCLPPSICVPSIGTNRVSFNELNSSSSL